MHLQRGATAGRLQCRTASAERLQLWSDARTDALHTYTTRAPARVPPQPLRQEPGDAGDALLRAAYAAAMARAFW